VTNEENLASWSKCCSNSFQVWVFEAIRFMPVRGLFLAYVMVHVFCRRSCNNLGLVASVCISCPYAGFGVCYCCYNEFSGDVHVLSPYA
jgi:hypothetical protein